MQPSIICCGGGGGGGGGGSGTDDPAPVPAEKFLRSPGGVDMRTGQLLYSHTDLSMGGEQGIALIRQSNPTDFHLVKGPFGGFTHNWDIRVDERRIKVANANTPDEYDYQVSVSGLRSSTYRSWWSPNADGFVASSNNGFSMLQFETAGWSPSIPERYTYVDSEGLRIEFRSTGPLWNGGDGCGSTKCAYASKVIEPDGTTYTLSYDTFPGTSNARLRRVVSNRGYALLFEYGANGTSAADQVTKACVLNLAYTALPAISGEPICPTGVPTSTYSYSAGVLTSYVDQGGVSTNIGPNGSALYWPGESTPFLTNSLSSGCGGYYVNSQSLSDGRSYTYSWVYDGNTPYNCIMGGAYADNNGKTVTVQYGKYRHNWADPTWYVTPSPEVMTDEIGRTWTYFYGCSGTAYCYVGPVRKVTEPEGNLITYTYGSYNNPIEIRRWAKPGTGLADILTTATYSTSCNKFCSKPLTRTDANGHTTNYTYDPVHGGLLTAMGPAPAAGGARPLTVNTYAQRYAWTRNSSGVLTQETVPVWVLSSTTVCQTAAGTNPSPVCDASAPETVTTYQYGANGSAESLLVKGMAVSSGGTTLRTCYTYDQYSRKIGETRPNANLSVCP